MNLEQLKDGAFVTGEKLMLEDKEYQRTKSLVELAIAAGNKAGIQAACLDTVRTIKLAVQLTKANMEQKLKKLEGRKEAPKNVRKF